MLHYLDGWLAYHLIQIRFSIDPMTFHWIWTTNTLMLIQMVCCFIRKQLSGGFTLLCLVSLSFALLCFALLTFTSCPLYIYKIANYYYYYHLMCLKSMKDYNSYDLLHGFKSKCVCSSLECSFTIQFNLIQFNWFDLWISWI